MLQILCPKSIFSLSFVTYSYEKTWCVVISSRQDISSSIFSFRYEKSSRKSRSWIFEIIERAMKNQTWKHQLDTVAHQKTLDYKHVTVHLSQDREAFNQCVLSVPKSPLWRSINEKNMFFKIVFCLKSKKHYYRHFPPVASLRISPSYFHNHRCRNKLQMIHSICINLS